MNRFLQEVMEMDRRRRLRIRVASVLGAAILAIMALWSAGLPPSEWLVAIDRWGNSRDATPAEVRPTVPTASAPSKDTVTTARKNSDTASQGTDSARPRTPLPLYLVATTPGRNKNEGTARIGTSLDNPQTYAGGALLVNGARLAEIHKDHVVLTRGGKSAALYVHQGDPRADNRRSISELLSVSAVPAAPLAVHRVNEGLTDYVRPSPVYDGEVLRGYQVYAGVRAGVFARLGLEPGDIITSINDAPLNEPSQSIELFMQLMRGTAVVATVERKNTSRRITLDGALISADQESIKEASVNNVAPLAGS
jgi:type II secretion system protein C